MKFYIMTDILANNLVVRPVTSDASMGTPALPPAAVFPAPCNSAWRDTFRRSLHKVRTRHGARSALPPVSTWLTIAHCTLHKNKKRNTDSSGLQKERSVDAKMCASGRKRRGIMRFGSSCAEQVYPCCVPGSEDRLVRQESIIPPDIGWWMTIHQPGERMKLLLADRLPVSLADFAPIRTAGGDLADRTSRLF